ncbi:hypothetical protein GCM10011584_10240 [Nocardioides phosphati]|uniref:DNA topoisomerase (ATP-hydrolyzing) n=1 Tax=Nocardioides phosphati TaxID=1867775 RepID=A0ABQ2N702_9ACTN|nr:DNA gyrase subunit A [Nocardioides phosphati]GGO86905.1 hypothetical protein GCM10011584_10240 [Nocardioides phosphati]
MLLVEQLAIIEAIALGMERRSEVFAAVEAAEDNEEALARVRALLGVDDEGASAVLEMQLRRLTREQRERWTARRDELRRTIAELST